MAVLDVKHLSYYYIDGDSRRDIFDDVNVSFDEGCFYAILGESGCGKTTFLSILGGMDFRYQGEVFYLGEEIQSLGLDRYRRCGVSLIYQNYHLIPHLSAVENCLVAVDISDNVSEIDVDEIKSVLCRFGIGEDKYNRKVKKLSGGEQQRVAVARSILTKAPIILADEPTGNLDSESAMVIVKAFVDLAHKMNKCVIMVTHNDRLAMLADEVLVMDQNRRNLFKK